VGRYSQLQRERYAGNAGEHLSVPPVNTEAPCGRFPIRK
jgi:hypothetical protein